MPYFVGGIITSLIVCVIFDAVKGQSQKSSVPSSASE